MTEGTAAMIRFIANIISFAIMLRLSAFLSTPWGLIATPFILLGWAGCGSPGRPADAFATGSSFGSGSKPHRAEHSWPRSRKPCGIARRGGGNRNDRYRLLSVDHPILFLLAAKFGWVIPATLGSLTVKTWRRMWARPLSRRRLIPINQPRSDLVSGYAARPSSA